MAQIIHLRCRHCGEPLADGREPYCPPCNLYLCYRAMPILLGMMMTGRIPLSAKKFEGPGGPEDEEPALGYEDKSVLLWE